MSTHAPLRPVLGASLPRSTGMTTAVLGAAALAPLPVMAQSASPTEIPAVSVDAQAVDVPAYQPTEVSNTKLGGTPHDLPQTVTILTKQVMEDQAATTMREALRNVPGITFNAGEGGSQGDHPIIRGFSSQSDMYLDGVRDSGSYRRDTFNTESIEVLKGSSSMLFGRGSTGGSINEISKTAKANNFNEATLGLGTNDSIRGTADLNRKIDDHIAVRLNAVAEKSGVAGRDEVTNQVKGFAPTITFGLGLPTELTLSYLHQENNNLPDFGVPLLNGRKPDQVAWSNYYGLKKYDYEQTQTDVATARLKHKFNDALEVTDTFRMGRVARDQSVSRPQAPNLVTNRVTLNKTAASGRDNTILSNQLDGVVKFDTAGLGHELHTGVELARENYITRNRGFTSQTGNLTNPDTDATYSMGGAMTQRAETRADTAAGYMLDKIKLNDQWEVTAGIRYDMFNTDQTTNSNTAASNVTRYTNDEIMSYRGSLSYKPASWQHYYVAYGTSATPSATDLSSTAANTNTDPEKTRLWEVGGKWDVLKEGLSLSSSLFRIDKTNMRVTASDGSGMDVLDGQRRVQGVEFGATGQILPGWEITAGYSYLDSETRRTTTAAQLGKSVRNTPQHSASVWSTYKVTPDISIGGGAQYVGKQWADDTEAVSLDHYLLFNAMASYQLTEEVSLQLNVDNITDERYITTASNSLNGEVGAGRSATLTTKVRF